MISKARQRSVLRWVHLVLSIPILGYIYSPPAEAQQYASAVRGVFVPVIILTGFWMYAGVVFAVVGVALWLGTSQFFGYGTAILGQIGLFIARKIWLVMRARQTRDPA